MIRLGKLEGVLVDVDLEPDAWEIVSAMRTTHNGKPALLVEALYHGERVQVYVDLREPRR
jgi:hypothetical protein